ncbi:unnamed protein product [Lathyrus sativus]|nr:unnamed protein product [Lathyrus sativus]
MEEGLISVDRWANGSEAYFLTHLHSDHTQGLSSSWSHGPLFCSLITAKLLPIKYPSFDLSLLRILQIGTSHTLSLRSPSSSNFTTVHVTAMDACHCPGSVMLLFSGDFGCVLYTGDFRWEADCEKARITKDMLSDALDAHGVDVVYIDNTYANPTYDFPTRSVATQQAIDIISSHPDHDVIIGINTLGKEDLLVQISSALNILIWVWPERLQTMHLLGLPDIFTTDTTLTRVRAVPMYSFSIDTLEALNRICPTTRPTIGILPSGLPWVKNSLKKSEFLSGSFLTSRYKRSRRSANSTQVQINKQIGKAGSPKKFDQYIFSVPYSDHSNFAELEGFIKFVKPTRLKGIVSSSSCYVEPMYYFGRLCTGNQPVQQLHTRSKMKESGDFEDDNAELDRNRSKESFTMNESGKRVVTFSPETSFEDDNVVLDRNKSKSMFKMKESGKRVVAVCPKTSVRGDDDIELDRNRSKALKVKLSGFRMRGLSVFRRKSRGAKLSDYVEE